MRARLVAADIFLTIIIAILQLNDGLNKMENKYKILFVCVHNSARSQMAEAFLKKYGGDQFDVQSAGLEPGTLNSVVVKAMEKIGIDISQKRTQGVFDLLRQAVGFDMVITVCDGASAERCPIFPGAGKRAAWSFPDPSSLKGTQEEILEKTEKIRDQIEKKVIEFLDQTREPGFWIQMDMRK
jgi:arsenate reductase